MTKLKPYAGYKDSGIEWVGPIPAEWETRPLFAVSRENTALNKAGLELNLLSLSYGRIVRKDIAANDGLLPASFDTYQIIRRNDIVLRLTDLQNDKRSLRSAISPERGIITSAYLAVTPTRIRPSYLSYLLRAYDLQKVFYAMGGGLRQSMKFSDMKWLPVIVPPQSLQESITAYLDLETAKIDDLIGKQEQLIRVLAEKRQAIITHAVSAPAGASTPSKLRYQATLNPSVPPTLKAQQDAQRTFLPMSAVGERGEIDLSLTRPVREVLGGYSYFQDGDVSFAKVTPCFENGKGAVFRGLRSGEGFGTTELTVLRCRPSLAPDYLYLLTQSDLFRKNGVAAMTGAGGLKRVPDEFVRNFEFDIPDLGTQASIVATVRRQLETIDQLVGRAQRAVRLLAERRTALIAATVTGKIDVHEGAS